MVAVRTANGLSSRLVGINAAQWAGNYVAAGVAGISMDLRNFGGTELSLRLALYGAGGLVSVTHAFVALSSGSPWTRASFSLDPAMLTGDPLTVLASVLDIRLFHGTNAVFPGVVIASNLGWTTCGPCLSQHLPLCCWHACWPWPPAWPHPTTPPLCPVTHRAWTSLNRTVYYA
jgi:hypothetical protein